MKEIDWLETLLALLIFRSIPYILIFGYLISKVFLDLNPDGGALIGGFILALFFRILTGSWLIMYKRKNN